MFDLKGHVRSWRENLAAEGTYNSSDLDELESHLRDELAALKKKDLSEQEAFTIACLRIGDSKGLSREFAKVNAAMVFKRRLFWMCAGLLVYGFITKLASFLQGGFILAGATAGLQGYVLAISAELFQVAVLVLAFLGVLWLARKYTTVACPSWLRLKKGKVLLFSGLTIVGLIILAGPVLISLVTARILDPAGFGRIAIVSNISGYLLGIVWLFLLIGVVVKISGIFSAGFVESTCDR